MTVKPSGSPVIRAMAGSDLDQIVAIDLKVLGKSRPEHWQTKLEMVANRPQVSALVAEQSGRVIGFIIGGASRWEYGVPENIGWIDTIGVDPAYQRLGVAQLLFTEMVENLKQTGVDSIYTFVTRTNWKLMKFFENLGFQKGDMVNLELEI